MRWGKREKESSDQNAVKVLSDAFAWYPVSVELVMACILWNKGAS
jgi:hypothetical protein